MLDYFKLLKNVLPIPQNVYDVGNEKMWNEFEKNTGIIFPNDYRRLIDNYGTGGIGNFIWFLTPFVDDDNVNYLKKMNIMLESYKVSKGNFPDYFTYNLYPEVGGLLPWGYTENGDELYWKTNSSLDKWEIVIYESASSDCHNYKMQLIEFLYKIITKELICNAFPEDLFDKEINYVAVKVK